VTKRKARKCVSFWFIFYENDFIESGCSQLCFSKTKRYDLLVTPASKILQSKGGFCARQIKKYSMKVEEKEMKLQTTVSLNFQYRLDLLGVILPF
jgi:hypothetical protein